MRKGERERREETTREEIGANPVGGKDLDGEAEDPTGRRNQWEGEEEGEKPS